jgi:hypothetical protein
MGLQHLPPPLFILSLSLFLSLFITICTDFHSFVLGSSPSHPCPCPSPNYSVRCTPALHVVCLPRYSRWGGFGGLGVSVLAFGTQVRGFKSGRSRRIFKGEKILSTSSFGGEVKPSAPCRRFAACKRSLELRGSRILGHIYRKFSRPRRIPPSATRGLSRRWT